MELKRATGPSLAHEGMADVAEDAAAADSREDRLLASTFILIFWI